MSWYKKLSAEVPYVNKLESGMEVYNKLSRYVPETFTLKELADASKESLGQAYSAKPGGVPRAGCQLVAVLTCLHCEKRIISGTPAEHQAAVKELTLNLSKIITPVVTPDQGLDRENGSSDAANQHPLWPSGALVNRFRASSTLGIEVFEALMKQIDDPVRLEDEVLYALLVYTDDTQLWCSPQAKARATALLEEQFSVPGSPTKEQFLTEAVLQKYLRPLFSKSKPSSITASGRKAEYTDSAASRGENMPEESALTKPWKYTDQRAIPAVAWAVREADTQLIAKHWPLFIPVLLTLVDDATTPIRRRGLLIFTDFLSKFPDKTLHDTGLAQVIEDAIFPTLTYLPTLTPESESVGLLYPAYAALLRLADKQPAVGKDGIRGAPRDALLDKMLREGVFMGYFHAKEHVQIVEVLCRETAVILDAMGVHAVKHLKDLVPMLSTIMTDPFAPVAPATLLAAIKALQAVLANCWPRIPGSPWQDEIINALVLCWLHVAEHDRPATGNAAMAAKAEKLYAQIEQELLTSSKALAAVLKTAEGGAATDLASHVAPLLEKEPRLAKLFASN